MARCPSGRPDDMYDMPIHYGMYKAQRINTYILSILLILQFL